MNPKEGSDKGGGNARVRRLVEWLSIAAFVVAALLASWRYWEHVEEEKRLEVFFKSERILDNARGIITIDSFTKGKGRVRRTPGTARPTTALPQTGAAGK
jgi:membrane protein implicated in regulation of membrane protease activity